MRNLSIVLIIVTAFLSFASCHPRGIVELSLEDTRQCYDILAKEDTLFSTVIAALDNYAAGAADSHEKLLSAQAQCKDYLAESDTFVKQLYEKYQLSEKEYRLDVFKARFFPLSPDEKAAMQQQAQAAASIPTP